MIGPQENELGAYLDGRIARAKLGDAIAAVEAAICVYSVPSAAPDAESETLYSDLLARALGSSNPEVLVCAGDELVAGRFLRKDLKAAHHFYFKADRYSGYMGAYALGKLHSPVKSKWARKLFKKAAQNGHIPSLVSYHELVVRSIPLAGLLVGLIYAVADTMTIHRALRSDNAAERLWRYQDFALDGKPLVYKKLDKDRLKPFDDAKKMVVAVKGGWI